MLLAAAFLPRPRLPGAPLLRPAWAWAYPVVLGLAGVLIYMNAGVVRADIYYKQAWDGYHKRAFDGLMSRAMDRATAQRYYDAALYYYDRALRYAPSEDYYMLFYGKAFLERAEFTEDARLQAQYLARGEQVLQRAASVNPLNTDHTANLARLYRTWAGVAADAATRQDKLAQSDRYYAAATRLSPHNAALYNEWGRTLLDLGQREQALAKYQQSLALDDRFGQTYLLLGDYYLGLQDFEQARCY